MKKRYRSALKRRIDFKEANKYFLIICEGEKTEPNYFKSFRIKGNVLNLIVEGLGANTDSLVEKTIGLKFQKEKELRRKFDEVWCVFDKDSFTSQNFNRAIQLAGNNGFKVAYSNEAFELWYLLHFEFLDAGISRGQYFEKPDTYLGHKYEKSSTDIYHRLLTRQGNALRNAKKLLQRYNPPNPADDNPSTTVHQLVDELNKYTI